MEFVIRTSKRAKALRISVYQDGQIRVTVPTRTPSILVERFIARSALWIEKQVRRRSRLRTIFAKAGRIAEYKREARVLAEERCAYFAQRYGVTYRAISIRAQKSRWGSCSRNGNLSFNYKIALLPRHLADYVIVHELCHLIEFNHSAGFWERVAEEVPEHRAYRKELRASAFRFA